MDCPQLAVAKLSDLAVNVGADSAGLAHRVENPPYGFDVGVFAPEEQQHVAANGRIAEPVTGAETARPALGLVHHGAPREGDPHRFR